MNRQIWLASTCALALVACGKKADNSDKGKAKAGAPAATIDVAGVNALVPAALKDKIVFEQRTLVEEQGHDKTSYTLAAPKGWTQDSKMFVTLKGDDKAGFFTSMKVGTDCGGDCTAGKDWAKISEQDQFSGLEKGQVAKDEKAKNGRTMISTDTSNTKTTTVMRVWWNDGEDHYYTCSAELDESVKDAAPAFEKACSAVNVSKD